MCLIIYTPDGKIPGKHLRAGLARNRDGWGYVYPEGKDFVIRKGLDAESFWEQWKNDDTKMKGVPVVWHARATSHGNTDLDNCHPFVIPGHNLVMAHNGIIRHHADEKSELSDTRLFIRDMVTALPRGFLDNRPTRLLIGAYIGHSKLAFMARGGRVVIINQHLGTWRGNRWYSNSHWEKNLKQSESCIELPARYHASSNSDPTAENADIEGALCPQIEWWR